MRFCRSFMFMAALCIGLGGNGFTPAQAAPIIFFGEDINNSGEVRIYEFPDSISAQTDFLSHLERSKINEKPFTMINFEGINIKNNCFGFDDFTIGVKDQVINPTPEPDTMVLLGCGLIFLGACTRKLKYS